MVNNGVKDSAIKWKIKLSSGNLRKFEIGVELTEFGRKYTRTGKIWKSRTKR